MANITFHAVVTEEADGSFWASVDELPGCFASGFSMDELKDALLEAMQLYLPEGISFENPSWKQLGDRDSEDASVRSRRELLICA
jgi:predicted RNase H-like HicB family nuclease